MSDFSLTFLGSGSAFFPPHLGNYQSNMVITSPDNKKLLVDCGTQCHQALQEQGLSIFDVDAIYISHLHADHIGGLEEAAFKTYFNPNAKKPKLIANGSQLNYLWDHSLKGGLASIQGRIVNLSDYFELIPVPRNGFFLWEGIKFTLVRTVHILDGFDFVPSYGLMFKVDNTNTFITTDAQFAPNQMVDFYNMSDLIFQDCETTQYKSGVHAHFSDLATLPDTIKSKMWLYHWQPGENPDPVNFAGYVKKGQTFEL